MPDPDPELADGWWEEYKCGCVSPYAKRRKDLLGYCPRHGESRRHVHPPVKIINRCFEEKDDA